MVNIISKSNTNHSSTPLVIWFLEVFVVVAFCCVVIYMSLIPWPPTYTLNQYYVPVTSLGNDNRAVQEINRNSTIIFSIMITNTNTHKDIIYRETKITLHKNGSILGESTFPGFYQAGTSSTSRLVLVNTNHDKLRLRSTDGSGDLEVGLKTMVRYKILGWTTKRHLLSLGASVPIAVNGELSLGEEGIELKPVKTKL